MEDDEDNGIRPGLSMVEQALDFQKDAVVPQAGEVQGLHHRRLGGPGQDLRGARRLYYQERNDRILVLCPGRLRDN